MVSYYVEKEFDLGTFEAWGGAVGRLDDIIELGIVEQAQEYMEDMLDYTGSVVTSTDINDLLWLGMDDFIEYFAEMQEEEEEED